MDMHSGYLDKYKSKWSNYPRPKLSLVLHLQKTDKYKNWITDESLWWFSQEVLDALNDRFFFSVKDFELCRVGWGIYNSFVKIPHQQLFLLVARCSENFLAKLDWWFNYNLRLFFLTHKFLIAFYRIESHLHGNRGDRINKTANPPSPGAFLMTWLQLPIWCLPGRVLFWVYTLIFGTFLGCLAHYFCAFLSRSSLLLPIGVTRGLGKFILACLFTSHNLIHYYSQCFKFKTVLLKLLEYSCM